MREKAMKVVCVVVPEDIFNIYSADLDASYCPETETMHLPVEHFSALVNHPLTLELVNDIDIDIEFVVCNDD
jgi:hypothetical protein